jgi:hypothetical protein
MFARRVTWLVVALALVSILACVLVVDGRPASLQPVRSRLQQSAHASHRASAVAAHQSKAVGSKLGEYYHSTRQIYDAIQRIGTSCPHMTISWERAPTSVDKQSKSLMSVRLNFDSASYPRKPERALFFFGEHARELISPEVGLEFIRRACDPTLLDSTLKHVDANLRDILTTTEFLIFPNANPSGRRLTEAGAYCNRVNDRKVDLNRNVSHTHPCTHALPSERLALMSFLSPLPRPSSDSDRLPGAREHRTAALPHHESTSIRCCAH